MTPGQSGYGQLSPAEQVVATLIGLFVEQSPAARDPWRDFDDFPRKHCVRLFRDPWHVGLPMDNLIDDRLLPVTFTELWLPIERALDAMSALRRMFRKSRLAATGTFTIELYAAKQSPAWLSPAYRGDVFRIDPFWCDNGDDAARDAFFQQYWDVLREFRPCLHWGKALPAADSASDLANRAAFTKLEEFLALRKKYDPSGMFVTDYWRSHLGIGPKDV